MIPRLLIILFLFCGTIVNAQENSIIFRARLVNAVSGEAVSYAHVIIENKNLGISSTFEGDFSLLASLNDTIKITAVGYEDTTIVLDEYYDLDNVQLLEMIPTVYELPEVEISPYLTYAELRRAIVNFELSDDDLTYIRVRNNLQGILDFKEPTGEGGLRIGGPVSLLYSAFSKHAKTQRKLRKMKKQDSKDAIVLRKYNPQIVETLTGLQDDEMIKKFMKWCSYTQEYLIAVDELELYTSVVVKYKEFAQIHSLN